VDDALGMKIAQTLGHLLADLKLLAHCEPSLLLKESLVQAASIAKLEDEACGASTIQDMNRALCCDRLYNNKNIT
jgi:hypothetical protein